MEILVTVRGHHNKEATDKAFVYVHIIDKSFIRKFITYFLLFTYSSFYCLWIRTIAIAVAKDSVFMS